MSRRQPPRRTSSARRRSVAGPSPAQLAAAMVDAVAADLMHDDPLQAQLVASYLVADRIEQYWAALADAEDDAAAEAIPRPALGLVRLLAELREPSLREPALALVLALASLDPDEEDVQDAAVEAVKRFRFLGAKLPSWAEEILEPELLGTWLVRDVFSEMLTLYVGTRHAGGTPAHCVAARIEHDTVAELVDVFASEGPDVLVPQVQHTLETDVNAALLLLEEIPPARAGQLLWDALDGVEETFGEALDDDAFELLALLESRASLLAAAMDAASDTELLASPHTHELDELDVEQLAERLLASDAWRRTDGVHAELAPVICAWVTGTVANVTRFGPSLALELLGELAGTVEAEEEQALLIEHGIASVRAWARFTVDAAQLPDEALVELETVLDSAAHEFERVVREAPTDGRSSLTDQVIELMLQDGVDVGDQAQLDAWSATWNALTDEQRLERIDSLG